MSSDLSPRLFVGVEFFWNVGVERGEANALIVSCIFLRRGKLRVVSADRAATTHTFVDDVVFRVDVVFGSAAVGEVAV